MPDTSPQSPTTAPSNQSDRSIPFIAGGLSGAGAYLIGYVITYVWKAPQYRDTFAQIQPVVEFFGGETPPPWKLIGWLYHSAHFVESRVTVGPVTAYVDLVAEGAGNLEILYLLPPLLILLAGVVVARQSDSRESMMAGAQSGASVVLGYFMLVLIGAVGFQINGSGPELVPSLLLAGIVYPLVFGAIGGVFGYLSLD